MIIDIIVRLICYVILGEIALLAGWVCYLLISIGAWWVAAIFLLVVGGCVWHFLFED